MPSSAFFNEVYRYSVKVNSTLLVFRYQSLQYKPPTGSTRSPGLRDISQEGERLALRLSTLEFMVGLSEAHPTMLKKAGGRTEVLVKRVWRAWASLRMVVWTIGWRVTCVSWHPHLTPC